MLIYHSSFNPISFSNSRVIALRSTGEAVHKIAVRASDLLFGEVIQGSKRREVPVRGVPLVVSPEQWQQACELLTVSNASIVFRGGAIEVSLKLS